MIVPPPVNQQQQDGGGHGGGGHGGGQHPSSGQQSPAPAMPTASAQSNTIPARRSGNFTVFILSPPHELLSPGRQKPPEREQIIILNKIYKFIPVISNFRRKFIHFR
jgi:hypothetical protein